MPMFTYEVFSRKNGANSHGTLDADSIEAARTQLKSQGMVVMELRVGQALGNRQVKFGGGGNKVKIKDVAWAARNLATTQTAGLPIPRALKMLSTQRPDEGIGRAMLRIHEDIIGGRSLGEAFAAEEKHLGKLTTAMVQAGESSGKLHESLTKLADITESRVRLKRKVMSAMTYPVVMVGLVVMIFFAMLMFVVPTFASIYDQIDGKLPKLTEFLMSMSFFLRHNILMVGIAGVGGAIGFSRLKKLPQFKLVKDRVIIRLPLFGDLFRSAAMARVATTLASSLGAGVPLLDSLQLSADVANNKLYSDALMQAREDVRNGKSLGNSLRSKPIINEMFTALVDIGEETGQLDALLNRYAEIVEEEVEAKVEAITSLIEPIMIVVFGGLVGVMVIALYLPLINIFKFLQ